MTTKRVITGSKMGFKVKEKQKTKNKILQKPQTFSYSEWIDLVVSRRQCPKLNRKTGIILIGIVFLCVVSWALFTAERNILDNSGVWKQRQIPWRIYCFGNILWTHVYYYFIIIIIIIIIYYYYYYYFSKSILFPLSYLNPSFLILITHRQLIYLIFLLMSVNQLTALIQMMYSVFQMFFSPLSKNELFCLRGTYEARDMFPGPDGRGGVVGLNRGCFLPSFLGFLSLHLKPTSPDWTRLRIHKSVRQCGWLWPETTFLFSHWVLPPCYPSNKHRMYLEITSSFETGNNLISL